MNEIQQYQGQSMTTTTGLTEQSIQTSGETVTTMMAARAKAEVEARFIMAERHPRDWNTVRVSLLKACERPGFAATLDPRGKDNWGVAWYRKPVGSGVEGFSVRFAEECIRQMGNLDVRTSVQWEDQHQRHVFVDVIDLEKNVSFPQTFVMEKTVERQSLKKGEVAISMRENSYGKIVYTRAATDDELLPKQNGLVSKALRNAVLRLVPGDIQAECRSRILQIRAGDMAKDPDQGVKRVADSFAELGVKPSELKKYLGHPLDSSAPVELIRLRDIYKGIRSGEFTWADIISEDSDDSSGDDKKTRKTEVAERPVEVPEQLNVFDELEFALSDRMPVQEKAKWISKQCKKAGWDGAKLTEAQASALLDILNEGGQNGTGGDNQK